MNTKMLCALTVYASCVTSIATGWICIRHSVSMQEEIDTLKYQVVKMQIEILRVQNGKIEETR